MITATGPQEPQLRDGGHWHARKGTSTTVPVMLSPTVTVLPSEAACFLMYPNPKCSDSVLPDA